MDRSTRRKTERKIRKLMSTAADNCSLCGIDLPHTSQTFGGLTVRGEAALVGECCQKKLLEIVLQGLYVKRGYEFLPTEPPGSRRPPQVLSPEKIDATIKS